MKIDVALDAYLQYISTEKRFSALTVDEYAGVLRQFVSFLAETYSVDELEGVSAIEVRDWQLALSDGGAKASSIRTKLAVLRSFFKFLRREGYMSLDIMSKVAAPRAPKRLPVFFTEKEVSRIYDPANFDDSFEGFRNQLVLRLLYETGIRRAELLGMKESSVDFSAKTLKVLGKRDKERIIPLENEILDTIKCYFSLKREQGITSDAFFAREDGTPFKEYDVSKIVKKYMTALSNAEKVSPHVFRHSFATHLLNEGADIEAIKELLGHASLSATEVYTHVSRQQMKETYKHAHPREVRKKEK